MSKWHYTITSRERIRVEKTDKGRINASISDITDLTENDALKIIKSSYVNPRNIKRKFPLMDFLFQNLPLISLFILTLLIGYEARFEDTNNTICLFLAMYSCVLTTDILISDVFDLKQDQKNKLLLCLTVIFLVVIFYVMCTTNEIRNVVSNFASAILLGIAIIVEFVKHYNEFKLIGTIEDN